MTTKDEALKRALELLESMYEMMPDPPVSNAIKMCREALAQKDEQEPVGETEEYEGSPAYSQCMFPARVVPVGTKLYTAPPTRKPRLTDEQIIWMVPGLIDSLNDPYEQVEGDPVSSIKIDIVKLVRAVEAYYRTGVEHDAMD